jgi:hypothetical protein
MPFFVRLVLRFAIPIMAKMVKAAMFPARTHLYLLKALQRAFWYYSLYDAEAS